VRAGAILKRARHHYGDRGARMAFFEGPAVRTGPADYVRHDPAVTPREQVSHGRTEPFAGVRRRHPAAIAGHLRLMIGRYEK